MDNWYYCNIILLYRIYTGICYLNSSAGIYSDSIDFLSTAHVLNTVGAQNIRPTAFDQIQLLNFDWSSTMRITLYINITLESRCWFLINLFAIIKSRYYWSKKNCETEYIISSLLVKCVNYYHASQTRYSINKKLWSPLPRK